MDTMTPFPPGFVDNPYSYGMALFSDILVSALCLAQLLAYLFEARRKREAGRQADAVPIEPPPLPLFASLNVFRMIVSCFLTTLLARALPDALWLLAWGEASIPTMTFLTRLDWYGDIFALAPFVFALGLITWSWQAIPQRLVEVASIPLASPKWEQAKPPLKIALLVLLIAVGVTIGKASV